MKNLDCILAISFPFFCLFLAVVGAFIAIRMDGTPKAKEQGRKPDPDGDDEAATREVLRVNEEFNE